MMNVKQVLSKIEKLKLTTPKEFKAAHIPLVREGAGIFRVAMRVKGLPLVVKFPLASGKDMSFRGGKMHSTVEVRKIKKLARISWMRPHLPRVLYHDKKSGVLVMDWKKEFDTDVDAFRALGRLTTKLIRKWKGVTVSDIHEDNVRQGRSKREVVLVDLGY